MVSITYDIWKSASKKCTETHQKRNWFCCGCPFTDAYDREWYAKQRKAPEGLKWTLSHVYQRREVCVSQYHFASGGDERYPRIVSYRTWTWSPSGVSDLKLDSRRGIRFYRKNVGDKQIPVPIFSEEFISKVILARTLTASSCRGSWYIWEARSYWKK